MILCVTSPNVYHFHMDELAYSGYRISVLEGVHYTDVEPDGNYDMLKLYRMQDALRVTRFWNWDHRDRQHWPADIRFNVL